MSPRRGGINTLCCHLVGEFMRQQLQLLLYFLLSTGQMTHHTWENLSVEKWELLSSGSGRISTQLRQVEVSPVDCLLLLSTVHILMSQVCFRK